MYVCVRVCDINRKCDSSCVNHPGKVHRKFLRINEKKQTLGGNTRSPRKGPETGLTHPLVSLQYDIPTITFKYRNLDFHQDLV